MLTVLLIVIAGALQPAPPRPEHTTSALVDDVEAGWWVTASVEQGERDLAIDAYGPDGRRLLTVDAWARGQESIGFVAGEDGSYRFVCRVVSTNARGRAPQLSVRTEQRPSIANLRRAEALRLSTDAKQQFDRKDPDGLRDAVAKWTEAVAVWKQVGDDRAVQLSFMGLGDARYRLSALAEAQAAYGEAMAISRDRRDDRSAAEIAHNLGIILWSQGRVPDARRRLVEAKQLWEGLSEPSLEGRAATETALGILAWEAGSLDEARRHNGLALSLVRQLGDLRAEAYVLTNAALTLASLNQHAQAADYLAKAVTIFQSRGDYTGASRALVRRARIELADGHRRQARRTTDDALTFAARAGDRLAEADARETLGRLLAVEAHPEATSEFGRARLIYRDIGSRRGESDVDFGLGTLAAGEGRLSEAMEWFREARRLRADVGLKGPEAEALASMAQIAGRTGDVDAAVRWTGEALDIVEGMRGTVLERELRLSYGPTLERFAGLHVDALVQRYQLTRQPGDMSAAFDVVDRTKARMLVESLRRAWEQSPPPGAETLIEEERAVREEIALVSWRQWSSSDAARGAGTDRRQRDRLAALTAQRDALEASILRLDDGRRGPRTGATVRLSDIQRNLDDDTTLLQYSLRQPAARVWVVTRSTVSMAQLGATERIDRLSGTLRGLVASPTVRQADIDLATQALSRLVLAPIASELGRRIIVVPDGHLHDVPFQLLTTAGGSALLESHEVASLPSAATLLAIRDRLPFRPPPTRLMTIAGDGVYSDADGRLRGTTTVPRKAPKATPLARLAFSRKEAEAIAKLAQRLGPTYLALGFDARRELALTDGFAQSQFIHVAAHALGDANPDLSAIVFSLRKEDGAPVDGFLRLQDLYSLRLAADLVVLSGCSTGTGPLAGAEGILSLARGVLHAGSRQVIVSLWDVDDAATSELMIAFYRRLFATPRESPEQALRQAQMELRASPRFAHPYFWAGWSLIGALE